jgi:hypothetical protein
MSAPNAEAALIAAMVRRAGLEAVQQAHPQDVLAAARRALSLSAELAKIPLPPEAEPQGVRRIEASR